MTEKSMVNIVQWGVKEGILVKDEKAPEGLNLAPKLREILTNGTASGRRMTIAIGRINLQLVNDITEFKPEYANDTEKMAKAYNIIRPFLHLEREVQR
jgi:hypothetical protein